MFHEGQTVTSIGDGSDGVPLGSQGHILLLASAAAGHVQWTTGPRTGEVTFCPQLEDQVAPAVSRQASAQPDLLEDSLEYGTLHRSGARHALATGGLGACFQVLASTGAFSEVGALGDDALAYVEGQLRRSASLAEHLAELDEEDRHEVYRLASRKLLAEALGSHDG